MSRLAETFKVAQSLVEAMSGLLVALIALAAALGIRRRRKARSPQPVA
jgi:MYXO-CTERM domain-containing protein